MNNIPVNYAPFCEEKKCPEFIRWQIEGTTCESCKKVGQSYDLNEYPPDCLHIEDIEDYKTEQESFHIKGI